LVLTACSPNPSDSSPIGSVSESGAANPDLPASCAPIDLRSPEGQKVDLTGVWAARPPEVGFFLSPNEMTWIHQEGTCVWAAMLDAEFRADPDYAGTLEARGGNLGTFQGQVSADLVVVGDLVAIRIGNPFTPTAVAPIRLKIVFQPNGEFSLREEREREGFGPRCYRLPAGDSFCPDRVILFRVREVPES
jgi:hypothetical protein